MTDVATSSSKSEAEYLLELRRKFADWGIPHPTFTCEENAYLAELERNGKSTAGVCLKTSSSTCSISSIITKHLDAIHIRLQGSDFRYVTAVFKGMNQLNCQARTCQLGLRVICSMFAWDCLLSQTKSL